VYTRSLHGHSLSPIDWPLLPVCISTMIVDISVHCAAAASAAADDDDADAVCVSVVQCDILC